MISMSENTEEDTDEANEEGNSLTIWNDRPQAGSVHYDGGLKLLIDRRVKTRD